MVCFWLIILKFVNANLELEREVIASQDVFVDQPKTLDDLGSEEDESEEMGQLFSV